MAPIRVGINGFGRIGRTVFRIMHGRSKEFEVVCINDLSPADGLAHLLKYDTVMGRFGATVTAQEGGLVVDGKAVRVTAEKDPSNLPWKGMEVDIAIESTGIFRKREEIARHLTAGARKVVRKLAPAATRRIARRLSGDAKLKAQVDAYLDHYDVLLHDAVDRDPAGLLTATLLGSEAGRSYLLLDAALSD